MDEDINAAGNGEVLIGSSVQPSTFTDIDGNSVQLGTVVAAAHTESGLTVADWNAAPESERERLLAEQVAAMGLTPASPSLAGALVIGPGGNPQDPPANAEPEPLPVEGLAVASAQPLPTMHQAINDLDENPGRTASLSEAGYVVRDGAA